MPILEASGVTKYFGGLAAVSNVDLSVERGEVYGLIGPNGAGKTTLFNLIAASLVPKPGIIKFNGINITGKKPYQVCRLGLGMTFQTVKIFANMSVLENVLLGSFFGSPKYVPLSEARKRSEELLEFVGLSEAAPTPAKDLTLSSQKRLEVARAMAGNPELLLLDEVMAGLTQTEVSEAMRLVNRIREQGITIVMIEHVMKAIMNLCDRILVLHHGEKIAEGTPEQVAKNEQVIAVYLGE
ncbi:MAG: ABC transporter ATP-binding protein [Desulfobacteraceae bacterium]|nr:ABC transporter ATP-binding protein [Desulfobacteraceae bacterium]